jgi:beta-phosphoglucomutase-like phosphatase (HAD superfamily)
LYWDKILRPIAMAALRAVLFDFDGVIVDSEPLHFGALRDALAPEAIFIDEAEYVREYLAYDDRGAIRSALERHGHAWDGERVERIARRKAELFEELLPSVGWFPGARELVRALASETPLAIASGALRAEIEAILDAGGLRGAFSAIVGAGDVANGKPHPEPYLRAMRALRGVAAGLQPAECVVIEDSMPGIAAARAAGMTVVAVTNSYPAERLTAAQHVVDSLERVSPASLRALLGG